MNICFAPPHSPPLPALEFLRQQFPDLPASYLSQLLKRGKFRIGTIPLRRETLLQPGDFITLPGSHSFQQRVHTGAPAILHESPMAMVVNKPALLTVHAGLGHQDDNLLRRMAATMQQRKAPYKLHAVHRLDRETSGALLLAKGKQAAGDFGRLLMNGDIQKQYLALVCGNPGEKGLMDAPLKHRRKLRTAATAFRTIARSHGYSLLQLELYSGRTHQIRRHLAEAGTPLYGDSRYGDRVPGSKQFYLHCRSLSWPFSGSGTRQTITAPLPEPMLAKLYELGFQHAAELPELPLYARNFGEGLSIPRHTE